MTEDPVTAASPQPTGIPSIDSVLDLVAGLDERPLEEHVEVFEAAHSQLRRTLDDPRGAAGAPHEHGAEPASLA